MRFDEFVIEFHGPTARTAPQVLELRRTFCACHWKEVWVADSERLPYLCPRLKELPSAIV